MKLHANAKIPLGVFFTLCLSLSAAANVGDGLLWIFKARDGVADGTTDTSNFRDMLTVSAETTKRVEFSSVEGRAPYLTNMTVKAGVPNTSETETCLYLGQPTNYVDGVLQVHLQSVAVPKAYLATGTEASFFARIKWEGRCFPNSGDAYPYNYAVPLFSNGHFWGTSATSRGWSVWLNADGGVSDNAALRVVVGNKHSSPSDAALKVYASDGWVDLAVTLRKDGDKTHVTYYICKSSSHNVRVVAYELDDPAFNDPTDDGSIGSDMPSKVYSADGNYKGKSWNFRGAIGEMRLWDRCLAEDEMRAVFAGQPQGWSVGVENGSADEFSDAECVDGFNPRTMQWGAMRKTLTAGNRSVSLSATFPADRRSLPRALRLKPILSAEATGAMLDVSLNGTSVGTVKLRRNRDSWLFVKESTFNQLVGPDEAATFTLSRTGNMAGTVMFDCLELTGSFQLGKIDSSYGEFTWHPNMSRSLYSSAEDTSIYVASLPPSSSLDVYFPLAQAVADRYRFRFSTRLYLQTEATLPLLFQLNGVDVLPTEEADPARTFHFDIEPGVLRENNKFSIFTGSSSVAEGNKDYAIDYYRLDVIDTEKTGFFIVVR